MADRLILLHGLWMRGIALTALRRRFEAEGFQVEVFDYMSVGAPFEKTLGELRTRMYLLQDTVHLVGHSLGGLVALLACQGQAALPPGRIVCMGSPLTGSAAAHWLADRGGSWLLGHSRAVLEEGLERWEGPREAGMIAGRMPVGLGVVLGKIEGESDGTVTVEETRLPGLTDHCVVETSHTGMLFSADASIQAVAFLRHGRFIHATTPASA
jgi:pimeloyl-ACP methyl ester carboxylesterase